MARTRSTKSAPTDSKASADSSASATKYSLPPQSEHPSKIFVLPSKAAPEARIVTLPHPRHSKPSRYLVCPETGIYEFTKIAAPKAMPRSWLIETSVPKEVVEETTSADAKLDVSTGADLFVATLIDPVFLLLPALAEMKASKGADEQKRLFLTSDDHFDKLPEESSHLSEILRCNKTRKLMESRMAAICDTVEAGDESMFRLNEKKLLSVIMSKAKRISKAGLPPSMEEKFVKKALEAPILIQQREMTTGEATPVTTTSESQISTAPTDTSDSQSTITSADSATSSVSQASTAATSVAEEPISGEAIVRAMEASSEVTELQRLRVAFNFICSTYVSPIIASQLNESLSKDASSFNFTSLDDYLAQLSKLRAETVAAGSMNDYSRKHGRDEEEDEARIEKKRKLEEEKKRKSMQSRGVRDLKKVDTSGMKKLSAFFTKK